MKAARLCLALALAAGCLGIDTSILRNGANFNLFGGVGPPLFNCFGQSSYDSAADPLPELLGDWNDPTVTSSTMIEDGELDIAIEIEELLELELDPIIPDEPKLLTSTSLFSEIFADDFELGQATAWTNVADEMYVIIIFSPNPDIRFRIIPEPASGLVATAGAVSMLAVTRRRRPANCP